MGTNRSYIRRPQRSRLSPDQELDLWLGRGPLSDPWPFVSEEARQAAWLRHREHLIGQLPSSPGRRLQAWWQYFEGAPPYPGPDREASTLYAAGLLGEAEKVELEADWRREFDRAQEPGFWLCLGPGDWLEGAAARRAHYRWADIPRALVKRWTAERKRQARTIRQLQDAAEFESVLPPV
jgi:hypothetical protein